MQDNTSDTGEYLWYSAVGANEPLMQGDHIDGCPVISPKLVSREDAPSSRAQIHEVQGYKLTFDVQMYNVVILSQSCDLTRDKLEVVLVCPYWPLTSLEQRIDNFKSGEGRKALAQGGVPAYHLLPPCDVQGIQQDFHVVDFRAARTVPFTFLEELAAGKSTRLRLNPPYREYLSQAYARFIMRVGLPMNMPPLPKYKKPNT